MTPMQSESTQPLRRRFVVNTGRHVHLWVGGHGPAIVLIHGSPGNAWLTKPVAERLARNFSVYAVDTPGFGGSDSLPGLDLQVSDLADAYAELLDVLGIGPVSVYGTHSGAAIGLELARRHPQRVSGFVLEGVPAFSLEEQQRLLSPEYLLQFEPEILGGHYTRAWTRFHDQFLWFPWYRRLPSHLNEAAAGSAADIHLWVEMYFQALRHEYRPAYRAVIRHGTAARAAASEVRIPGVFMAERSDMLFSHLDRLPELADTQRVERISSPEAVLPAIESAVLSLPRSALGASVPAIWPASEYSFHDLPQGQMFIRGTGPRRMPPVLLLHDAPGAGRMLQELYRALAASRAVILPDLPGCGESDPLPPSVPALEDYADAVAGMLAARTSEPVEVYAVGHGAAVALELNRRHPALLRSLQVTGVLRCEAAERSALRQRLAPPITLNDDGSHWYRTWLMLRDSMVHWPWYAREPATLRRQALVFDADRLHDWTCDVMRQWHSYHHLIDAALDWSPDAAIEAAGSKLSLAIDPQHALHAADLAWSAHSGMRTVTLPPDPVERAAVLQRQMR
jgi:pimeloyl-ACP methyl ester carboxylesterase